MAGYLGSGDLYFNRPVNGIDQWLSFGNATKFEIKEGADLKQRKSKMKDSYGNVLDTASIKNPAEIAMTVDDLNKDNLALIFLGDVGENSVVAGTVTGEGKGVGAKDSMVRLDNQFVSTVVVKDAATGATTYVEGTDYEIISAERGLIKILGTGSIVLNEAYVSGTSGIEIDYAYANSTSNTVTGGVQSSIKLQLMLDGENFADQSKSTVDVWEAVLSPNAGFDFLSDDFVVVDLTGTLNTPISKPSAYVVNTDVQTS